MEINCLNHYEVVPINKNTHLVLVVLCEFLLIHSFNVLVFESLTTGV